MNSQKFYFNGSWYSKSLILKAACDAYCLRESEVDTDDKLQELVDAIVKGPPTKCANFFVSLKGPVK